MKRSGSTFLKVMSIIMIVAAVGGFITGFTMFGATGALGVLGFGSAVLVISLILFFASAVSLLLAGIVGLKAVKTGNKRPSLLWGGICCGIQVLSNLINWIWGSGFQLTVLLTGLLIPVLYLVSAARLGEGDVTMD